jgi:hypothetical protein
VKLIPAIEWRLGFWALAYLATVFLIVRGAIAHSQAAYDAGDLSAFAWTGFIPFIFPIFMMQAAYCVLPVAIVAEVVVFCLWCFGVLR